MKFNFKNYLKLGILFLGISFYLNSCQKQDDSNTEPIPLEEEVSFTEPIIETVSLKDLANDNTFNSLNDTYGLLLNNHGINNKSNTTAKISDTLGVTIETSTIKKITDGNYVSYTMLMIEPNDTSGNFSNLVIQEKDGVSHIFTVRYFKNQNKSKNTSTSSKGTTTDSFSMKSGITPYELWENEEGNSGSGSECDDYLTICNTVQVWVPVSCGCGHMPGQSCKGCNGNFPYYTIQTQEECEEIV